MTNALGKHVSKTLGTATNSAKEFGESIKEHIKPVPNITEVFKGDAPDDSLLNDLRERDPDELNALLEDADRRAREEKIKEAIEGFEKGKIPGITLPDNIISKEIDPTAAPHYFFPDINDEPVLIGKITPNEPGKPEKMPYRFPLPDISEIKIGDAKPIDGTYIDPNKKPEYLNDVSPDDNIGNQQRTGGDFKNAKNVTFDEKRNKQAAAAENIMSDNGNSAAAEYEME